MTDRSRTNRESRPVCDGAKVAGCAGSSGISNGRFQANRTASRRTRVDRFLTRGLLSCEFDCWNLYQWKFLFQQFQKVEIPPGCPMPDNHRDANSDEPVRSQDASATDVQTQRLLRQAEPFLDLTPRAESSGEESAAVAQPFQFEEFFQGARFLTESAMADGSSIRLDVEIGRTQLEHSGVAKLTGGSLVSLNSLANEPVDIFAQGRLVARAEVVTVDETPSLRIVEIV